MDLTNVSTSRAVETDVDVNFVRTAPHRTAPPSGAPVRLAFIFPGQGSYRPRALRAWTSHAASDVLAELEAGLGRDPVALSDDPEAGRRTADAQPAILAASLVAFDALLRAGVRPDVVAGHSLGEVSAAVAAGALTIPDGAALVAERGAAMAAACAVSPGTMAAVIKLGIDAVEVLVDEVDDLVIANDNAPGQIVVSGPPAAIDAIRARARDAGGRVVPLEVEGAFHSPAMDPARDRVARAVDDIHVSPPAIPFVSGTTASRHTTAQQVATGLVDGVRAPVRWREVQLELADLGVTHLVEVGPGGVLGGLARRTLPDVAVRTVATPTDVADVADELAVVALAS
jgi:[acyl-carrier-protein] S-malonyltransferase